MLSGSWDPSIRIEPPKSAPDQKTRRKSEHFVHPMKVQDEEEEEHGADLERTGRYGLCRLNPGSPSIGVYFEYGGRTFISYEIYRLPQIRLRTNITDIQQHECTMLLYTIIPK